MCRKLFIAFGLLLTVVGLFLVLRVRSAYRGWDQYVAEMRASGDPLSFEEIEGIRTHASDDEDTVARVIERTAQMLDSESWPPSRGVLGTSVGPRIDFFKVIPPDSIEATRRYVAPLRQVLEELAIIHDLKPGRLDCPYKGTGPSLRTTFNELSVRMGRMQELLFIDAALKLSAGHVDEAALAALLQLDLVSPLAEEPSLTTCLVRASGAAKAVRILESILRVGSLSDAALVDIDTQFEQYIFSHSMKWALWGQRALFMNWLDEVRCSNTIPMFDLLVAPPAQRKRAMEMLGKVIDSCDDGPEEMMVAAAMFKDAFSKRSQWTGGVRSHFIDVYPGVVLHVQSLTESRIARVAVAAERYRIQRGQLPRTLDDLVPRFLPGILADPFDGGEIKMVARDEGVVIYSVGRDGIDNGGTVELVKGRRKPYDIGFRLNDAENRGIIVAGAHPTKGS